MPDYIAYLHKDKGSDYGVSFPDFPGAITAGSTLDEARTLAREALNLHIKGMLEDGEAIPVPSTLDELADDPAMLGAVAFLVTTDAPTKVVRFNLTAPEAHLQAIDQEAREAGLTRSAFMVRAALAKTLQSSGSAKASPKSSEAKPRRGMRLATPVPRNRKTQHSESLSSSVGS